MELYDVMRTTAAVREFTGDSLPDDVLERILDKARFAPSGGNRQGARVIVVRDQATREALAELSIPGTRRYLAQLRKGEGRVGSRPRPGRRDQRRVGIPIRVEHLVGRAQRGLGGTITTNVVAEEPQVRDLLGVPESYAIAAVLPLGKPLQQLATCRWWSAPPRRPTSSLATRPTTRSCSSSASSTDSPRTSGSR